MHLIQDQGNPQKPTTKTGPGKAYRNGISWPELFDLFPDNATAERWFGVGHRPLHHDDRHQGHVVNAPASRPQGDAENRLVSGVQFLVPMLVPGVLQETAAAIS